MTSSRRTVRRSATWVVAGTGAALFLITNAPALRSVVGAFGRISPGFALAGLALSGLAILNRAGLNRAAHNVVGLPAKPMSMIRPATAGFAANKILRSGGVAGAAMFVRHGDTRLYRRGAVVGACALASLASFTALGLLLATSIALLAARGALTGWWTAAAIGFAGYAATMTAIVILGSRRRDLVTRAMQRAARISARLRRRSVSNPSTAVDDLADALAAARQHPRWALRAVSHALGDKALGAAMLLCAVTAVGHRLSLTDVIVIYAAALATSMASMVPAGVGVVEASTGALLVAAGAPLGIAALAVGLFRVFDLWIPVAAGALAARTPRIAKAPDVLPAPHLPSAAEGELVTA